MNKNRLKIVNSEIMKAISEIITYQLSNPKITGIISVTKVDTTSDLERAKVYLSIFTPDDKKDVFNEIMHSAGFIRKELAHKIELRKIPYLQFVLDTALEEQEKIDEVIARANKNN